VQSADSTFVTQSVGGELRLLDKRQWEHVSPAEKHGAGIIPQPGGGGVIQAAEDGSAISYVTRNPIETEPEGSRAPEAMQALSKRSVNGWTKVSAMSSQCSRRTSPSRWSFRTAVRR
jgi:hypothetical protein